MHAVFLIVNIYSTDIFGGFSSSFLSHCQCLSTHRTQRQSKIMHQHAQIKLPSHLWMLLLSTSPHFCIGARPGYSRADHATHCQPFPLTMLRFCLISQNALPPRTHTQHTHSHHTQTTTTIQLSCRSPSQRSCRSPSLRSHRSPTRISKQPLAHALNCRQKTMALTVCVHGINSAH